MTDEQFAIRIERGAAFQSDTDAVGRVAALIDVIAAVTPSLELWIRHRGELLPFGADTVALAIAEDPYFRADLPRQPSHVLSLSTLPTGASDMGLMLVNVRSEAPLDAAAGIVFFLADAGRQLPGEVSDLVHLLDACAQAVAADTAMLGPKDLMQSLGVGALTLSRRAPRDRLPPSARVIPGRSGDFILAHNEPLGSDSATARAALVRVQRALDPSLPLEDPPAEAPTAQAAPPTPILPAGEEPESRWARWAGANPAAATVGLDDSAIRQAILPFLKGAPSPQFFADADAARREARERPETPAGAQTLELGASLPLPVAGSPAATMGLVPLPSMSLEQYAAFCAELAVFPAKTADIHARYGVADAGALNALNEAFAWRFSVDRGQKQRWQALIVHYGEWFRREAAKGQHK